MYKILISGYYGFNNIGDESILMAVTGSLKEKLGTYGKDIEITVLSHDPKLTAEKYNVRAKNRKSIFSVVSEILRCNLLISGGGSLLQDVTSRKSILYYLFIMRLAKLFRKDFFIYSQGIGPINSKLNRKITRNILNHAAAIIVRDETSKEFLGEIGVSVEKVVVTADPVLRIKPAELSLGREIMKKEGCGFLEDEGACDGEKPMLVGFAVKERKLNSGFSMELLDAMEFLIKEKNCNILLIPFHYNEDMAIIEYMEKQLIDRGCNGHISAIRHKYLTTEMMSIIGNTDVLVGVRLHSLIHAAIMGVPMIGISYDPKVNSFMHSMGLKAISSIYDFKSEFFLEEFDKTVMQKQQIVDKVGKKVAVLREKLDTNEDMIKALMMKNKNKS